jgi:HlyD family secretion protein
VAALFRRGDDWAVFVLDGERVAQRAVKLGPRGPLMAVVEDGLAAGDQVIAYPSDALRDGDRVTVVRGR